MNTLHIFYDERGIWLLCVDLWKFSVQRWFLWIILLQYVQCWVFRLLFCFRHGYAGVIPGMMNKIKSVYLIKAEIFWITMDIQRSRFIQNILETKKKKLKTKLVFNCNCKNINLPNIHVYLSSSFKVLKNQNRTISWKSKFKHDNWFVLLVLKHSNFCIGQRFGYISCSDVC